MIQTICQYPLPIVMGVASVTGAGVMAGITIWKKSKSKRFKVKPVKLIDTAWQSTLVGISAGTVIGCSYHGIIIAALSGYGIDKIANKLNIKEKKLLNFVELLTEILFNPKKTKKKKVGKKK